MDVVEVGRVAGVLRRRGDRFLRRVFTANERCLLGLVEQDPAGIGPLASQRVAGRFAAKEAVFKALGTGLRAGRWQDVEVGRDPFGRPVVVLGGRLAETASRRGVAAIHVSITHTRAYAAAVAVAGGAAPERSAEEGAAPERSAEEGAAPERSVVSRDGA